MCVFVENQFLKLKRLLRKTHFNFFAFECVPLHARKYGRGSPKTPCICINILQRYL